MQPRFSNFSVLVISIAAVSITEKITSLFRVRMVGYPPPETKISIDMGSKGELKDRITGLLAEIVDDAIVEYRTKGMKEQVSPPESELESADEPNEPVETEDYPLGNMADTPSDEPTEDYTVRGFDA